MAIGEAPTSLDNLESANVTTGMSADAYVGFFKSYAPVYDPDMLTMTTVEWFDIINRLVKNGMQELDPYYTMSLAKDILKGVALVFVEANHYSGYDQMTKSLLNEFSDNWFKSKVLKMVESGEALRNYPIDQRRDRLVHLFKLMGSGKEAVFAIANYLYHEDNTAWEKVGIKPSQARAEDFSSYVDTYCNAADHIIARRNAKGESKSDAMAKELAFLKTSYNSLKTSHDDLLRRFEALNNNYRSRMGGY